ncbi:hypothetical protein [Haloferula sp. BvORR071]|uniref:hypothetical protein n=1 Tax=Haloferula sp. BvORR071 TaxID=1396141 RepID=UPI0005597544|nr:hypothetical protein [Haloferula sp. BvORR071]
MKLLPFVFLIALVPVVAPVLRADEVKPQEPGKEKKKEDPSDAYFQGWLLSREAEKLREAGKNQEAEAKLVRALMIFRGLRHQWPEWKKKMVKGRLLQTEETLKAWGWKEGKMIV